MDQKFISDNSRNRRDVLRRGAATTLSLAGLSVLAGGSVKAASADKGMNNPEADVQLINTALSLEHEGIAAYQIAAESGLLETSVLEVGVLFQGHHKGHRDELINAITTLGGQPVEAKPIAEYIKSLEVEKLTSQTDVLNLALRLELGAANAYLGVIPALHHPDYGHLFARLAADEAMHWTALTGALGKSLPANALYFG
ncbi:ferritin-like domain-containing protein [Hyphococcus formosus]|uniref:ferritin-like domain-containing protein n=1 Tax=Hyphococcus formosus TaxID=3143534 RepID=UPI00398B5F13